MIKITGFADEISQDPREQTATLKAENIRFLEFRAAWGKNVLALSAQELREFRKMLDGEGLRVSAIGSPVGKIKISEPFEPELARFKRSLEVADVMDAEWVRIFSYYPPDGGRIEEQREEVLRRMKLKVEAARGSRARLFNENESDLYGQSAENCLEIIRHAGGPRLLNSASTLPTSSTTDSTPGRPGRCSPT